MLAYHYTKLCAAVNILKSGIIERSESLISLNERPVVWFSKNELWEPSAIIGRFNNDLSIEIAEKLVGLVRFGYDSNKLKSIQNFKKISGCPPAIFKKMAKTGNQYEWLVSYEEIPVRDCLVEFRYQSRWIGLDDLKHIVGSTDPDQIMTFFKQTVGVKWTTHVRRKYLKINENNQIVDTRTGEIIPFDKLDTYT